MRLESSEITLRSGWLDPLWMDLSSRLWQARQESNDPDLLPRVEMTVKVGDVELTYVFTGEADAETISPDGVTVVTTHWRQDERAESA